MKYCKESVFALMCCVVMLTAGCSSFGKSACDRCPEFTQADQEAKSKDSNLTTNNYAE